MRIHVLERVQRLPGRREEVFGFFAEAGNLEAITPPWLRFRIVTPQPVVMREGARIEYRLRLRGIPLRWRTRIDAWDPPRMFVDRQVSGPYALWHHTHAFEDAGAGGTVMRDRVRYALPGGRLGDLLASRLVARDLERIFDFRAARVAALTARARPAARA